MANHQPVDIDPQQLQRASQGWNIFTQSTKWTVIGVAITLILMAVFLLP